MSFCSLSLTLSFLVPFSLFKSCQLAVASLPPPPESGEEEEEVAAPPPSSDGQ